MSFMDFLGKVGDETLELGSKAGAALIEREIAGKDQTPVEVSKAPTAAAPVVRQGEPAGVGLVVPGTFNVFGLPVDKKLVYAAGGVLALALVLKAVR